MNEIYISTDVETDGPIPGPNSMLSLGAAAMTLSNTGRGGVLIKTFSVNLSPLEGAHPDPETEAWWNSLSRDIYDACRKDPEPPRIAMAQYVAWIKSLGHYTPVFVGYPAGFDFLFVYWYLRRFCGKSPFSFSALDIKTYAMAMMKTGYRDSTKRNMPARWFQGLPPHTHRAVDDAVEQGYLFMNILSENLER